MEPEQALWASSDSLGGGGVAGFADGGGVVFQEPDADWAVRGHLGAAERHAAASWASSDAAACRSHPAQFHVEDEF